MPWLAPVAAPRRGRVEKAIMATPVEEVRGDPQDATEAFEAKNQLTELSLPERQLGLGEECPVLFVSRLGSAESAASNVSWLQQPSAHVLEVPAEEDRALKFRAPGWLSKLNAGFRRRIAPFPLFAKAVPQGCVVVASVKGEDLALLTDEGPPSLGKLFQEPPIGWLEPVGPLIKAAHDPRVKALILKIGPLSCGYAKIVELRRSMDYFKASGKNLVAYMDGGAEKEYYLALGCDEIYIPPGGNLRLQGFSTTTNFLRGVFDEVGVEPVVVRIGAYKGAGDTINRRNSTEEFRMVQSLLMNQTAEFWLKSVEADLQKSREEIMDLWENPCTDPMRLAYRKYITASLYFDQVKEMIAIRHRSRRFSFSLKERPARLFAMRSFLKAVGRGRRILPGLPGVRGPCIAIINAGGEISANGAINARGLVDLLEQAELNRNVKAVVLRVDSPGGDALTSELIWRRILKLRSVKPVVASMVDVAASGGYFLSMGCSAIVAEDTTITGSIGVVAVLFKLQELYKKLGLNEEAIGIGKYSKFFVPGRLPSEEEKALFETDVQSSYQDFVQKAAFCRNMTWDQAHAVAQGRVWKGEDARKLGLVDAEGGVWRAIEVAKRMAKIPDNRGVNLRTIRGSRRLFGGRGGGDEEDVRADLSPSSFSSMGQPMVLADDAVGDYMKMIGGIVPGSQAWTQGLGLVGGLALQQFLAPLLLSVDKEVRRRNPFVDLFS
ncbi:signal peptide peptidase [Nannochloropsis oceanica]